MKQLLDDHRWAVAVLAAGMGILLFGHVFFADAYWRIDNEQVFDVVRNPEFLANQSTGWQALDVINLCLFIVWSTVAALGARNKLKTKMFWARVVIGIFCVLNLFFGLSKSGVWLIGVRHEVLYLFYPLVIPLSWGIVGTGWSIGKIITIQLLLELFANQKQVRISEKAGRLDC